MAFYSEFFSVEVSFFTVNILEAKDYLHNFGHQMGSLGCFLYVALARNRVRYAVLFSYHNGGRRPMHVFSDLFSARKDEFRPILIHLCDRIDRIDRCPSLHEYCIA